MYGTPTRKQGLRYGNYTNRHPYFDSCSRIFQAIQEFLLKSVIFHFDKCHANQSHYSVEFTYFVWLLNKDYQR